VVPHPVICEKEMDEINNEKQKETGLGLGIFIILIQLGLMISATTVGDGKLGPVTKGAEAIIGGIYLQLWGLLFLLSYFFSHKCFFFRGLIWICENFSSPKGRKMAFFYFALAFGLGTAVLLIGLGVIQNHSR
jgi:hypothetical protein